MKKNRLTIALFTFLTIGIAGTSPATLVTVTYTGDNYVLALYSRQDEGEAVSLPLGPNSFNWPIADTITLDLASGQTYQFIWQVVDVGCQGGLLAEIAFQEKFDLTENIMILVDGVQVLTSSSWQLAHVVDDRSTTLPPDFELLPWVSATEWGTNDNSSWAFIVGIAGEAEWVWTENSFGALSCPSQDDSVFIRTTVEIPSVPQADISGCINEPSFANTKVVLKQKGKKKQFTTTNGNGCYEFYDLDADQAKHLHINVHK